LGDSTATKFVVPLELTTLLQPFTRHTTEAGQNGSGA
jgi:hypothetical protein